VYLCLCGSNKERKRRDWPHTQKPAQRLQIKLRMLRQTSYWNISETTPFYNSDRIWHSLLLSRLTLAWFYKTGAKRFWPLCPISNRFAGVEASA
jgi:hypothetical protein